MSPEPFDSRAKALPAKRSEKGYEDENAPAASSSFSSRSNLSGAPIYARPKCGKALLTGTPAMQAIALVNGNPNPREPGQMGISTLTFRK